VLNQLPNETKEKLLKADGMGIFQVIDPHPMRAHWEPQISPLKDLRPLLVWVP
jgi:hypothetical protein